MMIPPKRMPAATQIATRVRVGNVCEALSVEAGALLVDYGRGVSQTLRGKKGRSTTHGWVTRRSRRQPKVGSGGQHVYDRGAITTNSSWCHYWARHCWCGLLLGLAGENMAVIELIGHRRARMPE